MRVEAIRAKDIEKVKRHFRNNKDARLYPMLVIGLNTGLRISDIVNLKVKDIRGKEYLNIKSQQKTDKRREIYINENIKEVMSDYYFDYEGYEYLFKSQKGGHISADYAYILFKKAFKKCKLKYNLATHSMRKTYGRVINEKYGINMTQSALGHENQRDTLKYIGLEKEMLDRVIRDLNI